MTFKKLSIKKLLSAVGKTESQEIRQNAFQLGERINAEDGLNNAIEKLIKIS